MQLFFSVCSVERKYHYRTILMHLFLASCCSSFVCARYSVSCIIAFLPPCFRCICALPHHNAALLSTRPLMTFSDVRHMLRQDMHPSSRALTPVLHSVQSSRATRLLTNHTPHVRTAQRYRSVALYSTSPLSSPRVSKVHEVSIRATTIFSG